MNFREKFKYKYKYFKEDVIRDPKVDHFFLPKNNINVGLKSCWHKEQIATRLQYKPSMIELYLYDGDLENYLDNIEKTILYLKKKKIEVTIHQPEFYKKIVLTIASTDKKVTETAEKGYEILYQLCKRHRLKGFIMHPYSGNTEKKEVDRVFRKTNKEQFIRNLNKNSHWKSKILLENVTEGFFKTKEDLQYVVKKTGIKLCLDLCHIFMVYNNNKKIEKVLYDLRKDIKYYHIVDTRGKTHDSLRIGYGEVDFKKIGKYIKTGIIEVNCKNQVTAEEMLESYKVFHQQYYKWIEQDNQFQFNKIFKNLLSAVSFFEAKKPIC